MVLIVLVHGTSCSWILCRWVESSGLRIAYRVGETVIAAATGFLVVSLLGLLLWGAARSRTQRGSPYARERAPWGNGRMYERKRAAWGNGRVEPKVHARLLEPMTTDEARDWARRFLDTIEEPDMERNRR